MFKDKNDAIWIGTRAGGISKYDKLNEQFFDYGTSYQDVEGLTSNFCMGNRTKR